jgi:hypothetical protein
VKFGPTVLDDGAVMGSEMANHISYESDEAQQAETFDRLYGRVDNLLERFRCPNFLSEQQYGDYSVHGDYAEPSQVVVFVSNLKMLRPEVVSALQDLVKRFPGWEIELRVALWDHLKDWPEMGLFVRSGEIIDDLQRQYFPKEFQNFHYEGARGDGEEKLGVENNPQ